LKGNFEFFFSSKTIHEGELVKKGIITIDWISKIKGKKTTQKWNYFGFFKKLMHVHFVSSNEEQYEIMLPSDNNCVCKTIRLML